MSCLWCTASHAAPASSGVAPLAAGTHGTLVSKSHMEVNCPTLVLENSVNIVSGRGGGGNTGMLVCETAMLMWVSCDESDKL